MSKGEAINQALAEHQREAADWHLSGLAKELGIWATRMIDHFGLGIGIPALLLKPLRRNCYGWYLPGRNDFGLQDEIAIDIELATTREDWEIVGTLFHECLHGWQHHHGKSGQNNYHNSQFRNKAKRNGLIVDTNGYTQYLPAPTPFTDFLEEYEVKFPEISVPTQPKRRRGKSTLILCECGCGVKVRVGKLPFLAQCLQCNSQFEPKPNGVGS